MVQCPLQFISTIIEIISTAAVIRELIKEKMAPCVCFIKVSTLFFCFFLDSLELLSY